jgi:hypothetical protein
MRAGGWAASEQQDGGVEKAGRAVIDAMGVMGSCESLVQPVEVQYLLTVRLYGMALWRLRVERLVSSVPNGMVEEEAVGGGGPIVILTVPIRCRYPVRTGCRGGGAYFGWARGTEPSVRTAPSRVGPLWWILSWLLFPDRAYGVPNEL